MVQFHCDSFSPFLSPNTSLLYVTQHLHHIHGFILHFTFYFIYAYTVLFALTELLISYELDKHFDK